MIYKVSNNRIKAYGTIWEGDGVDFVNIFNDLEKKHKEISVHLHTGGGNVFEGQLIFNAINTARSNVSIIIEGLAASMGGYIILSTEDVQIVDNGYTMFHSPTSCSNGTADEKEKEVKLLRFIESDVIEKLASKTGKTKSELQKYLKGDNWLDAKESLSLGLVSKIIPANKIIKKPKVTSSTTLKSMSMSYMPLMVAFSKNQKNQKTIQMKKELINSLGLDGLTAESSDTAVTEALTAKFDTLTDENKRLKESLKTRDESEVKALVDMAIEADKIKKEQKEIYVKIGLSSGVDTLKSAIDGIKAHSPGIANRISNGNSGAEKRASWTFENWQDKDPQGLEKMAQSDSENFEKLFNNSSYKK